MPRPARPAPGPHHGYGGSAPPTVEELAGRFPQLGDPRTARPGRHGGGVQGPAAGARSPGGPQDPAAARPAATRPSPSASPARPAPWPSSTIRTSSPSTTFGQAGELYYFVMEYVDGVNLRQLLPRAETAPPRTLKIVPQICEAPAVRPRRRHRPSRHQAGEHPARQARAA